MKSDDGDVVAGAASDAPPTQAPESGVAVAGEGRRSERRRTSSKSKKEDEDTSSMTLAISRENATRMLEASRAFNDALVRLQEAEREDAMAQREGGDEPTRAVALAKAVDESAEREEVNEAASAKPALPSADASVAAADKVGKDADDDAKNVVSDEKGKVPVKKEEDGDVPIKMEEDAILPTVTTTTTMSSEEKETEVKQKDEEAAGEVTTKVSLDEDDAAKKETFDEMMSEGIVTASSGDENDETDEKKKQAAEEEETAVAKGDDGDATKGPTMAAATEGAKEGSSVTPDSAVSKKRRPPPAVVPESPASSKFVPTPLHKLLLRAASTCGDGLIESFVRRMRAAKSTEREMETSLLLFLDMDKSTKLLTAFGILSEEKVGEAKEEEGSHGLEMDGVETNEDTTKDEGNATVKVEEQDTDPSPSTRNVKMECDEPADNGTKNITKQSELVKGNAQEEPVKGKAVPKGTSEEERVDEVEDRPIHELTYDGMIALFKCFLTSISTCIHHEQLEAAALAVPLPVSDSDQTEKGPKCPSSPSEGGIVAEDARTESASQRKEGTASPSNSIVSMDIAAEGINSPSAGCHTDEAGDWMLSKETKREIREIAVFATDRLMNHVKEAEKKGNFPMTPPRKDGSDASSALKGPVGDTTISFEMFGDWYNSGGFSLVPWLELLDLAKWDYAGRAAAAAAVAMEEEKARTSAARLNSTKEEPRSESFLCRSSFPGLPSDPASRLPPRPSADRREAGEASSRSATSQYGPASALTPSNLFMPDDDDEPSSGTSVTLVSFDFSSAMPSSLGGPSKMSSFHINITEENLRMLRNLVTRTGFLSRSSEDVFGVLMRHSTSQPALTAGSRKGDTTMALHRDDFGRCVRELVPPETSRQFDRMEMELFSNFFTNFFSCFETSSPGLGPDLADTRELAVGFSFLCTGNKSTKLATGFELLDEERSGYLTQTGLTRYLKSYLTMLVGISLLSSSVSKISETSKMLISRKGDEMFSAVENGAKWTHGHFLNSFNSAHRQRGGSTRNNAITFEDFAQWYTEGGYNIAPWLELLDMKKFLSLLENPSRGGDAGDRNRPGSNGELLPSTLPRSSSRVGSFDQQSHAVEVLFTFPLANHRSLVVLREDAAYVRTVVDQLGLLSLTPEEVWTALYSHIRSKPPPPLPFGRGSHRRRTGSGKGADVDQSTFVRGMEQIVRSTKLGGGRKRPASGTAAGSSSTRDTLNNFFQSFDLDQVDRVAANELMGGLALLCGGKKSTKLSFAFGLFDGRKDDKQGKAPSGPQSLNGAELFLFLRSFLIVMFSCCKQSLDLSAEAVSRYIADTAHMVTEDVMRFQWHTRRLERVDFDDFGEWYNEGGFETAPWLELLDLNKWVLLDSLDATAALHPAPTSDLTPPSKPVHASKPLNTQENEFSQESRVRSPTPDRTSDNGVDMKMDINSQPLDATDVHCPPPPPEDSVDLHNPTDPFFGDDDHALISMDAIDGVVDGMEYAMLEQEETTRDKENDGNYSANNNDSDEPPLNSSPSRHPASHAHQGASDTHNNRGHVSYDQSSPSSSLKFHLLTNEEHGGYMVSIGQRRVHFLRGLLIESALYNIEVTTACNKIISQASTKRGKAKGPSNENPSLNKNEFDSAMRSIISGANRSGSRSMSTDTQQKLSDMLTSLFCAFDRSNSGEVHTLELACGFAVLCNGKKSDKLEWAFELLDTDKDGNLSRHDMVRYLRSFLTVLMSISSSSSSPGRDDDGEDMMTTMSGGRCGGGRTIVSRMIDAGSNWATSQVFNSHNKQRKREGKPEVDSICFDDFADWYTNLGYSSIPWLELLDLKKWVLTEVS